MVKEQGSSGALEARVLGFMQEHRLLADQHYLVVAVSGGQDSVCLLHILVALQERLKLKLHVAHLNHQLRGAESAAESKYVAQLAEQLGIPATLEERDVKDYQARRHISLEEAAREVRYTFLAEVAKAIGTDRVAVGHTTDDHIETILMHLVRGAGTRGLRGLQPSSQWQSAGASLTIVRPLLQVSRQETADYCYEHHLIPRLDSSNLSLLPLRNRIRQQLLPLLRSYNPRVTEALLRTAHIAGDDLAFLEQEGARLWPGIAQRQGDTIILGKAEFLDLPAALQRHLLRNAIAALLGNLKDIETRHIEEIMAILTKSAGKKLSLPGGLSFVIDYQQFRLSLNSEPLSPFPVLDNEFVLKIPGETRLPGWRVQTSIVAPSAVKDNSEEADAYSGTMNHFTAYFDRDKAGFQMLVRCRRPGDRWQPLGMSQPKTLGEFMIDAKIPRSWRQGIPIVCSPEHILWVVGWRIDDRIKVTSDTKSALCLRFERTVDTLNQTIPSV